MIILGANGKLGARLTHFAAGAGQSVVTQSRDPRHDVEWSYPDLLPDQLLPKGATIANMIGATQGDDGTLEAVNVTLVTQLLARARETGVAHVILASSAAVYGRPQDATASETDPLRPQSPYGTSKARMEETAERFAQTAAGPRVTILRIGNVAGADALSHIARQRLAENAPIDVHRFADGTAALRSYISPIDLFRVVDAVAVADGPQFQILNVAHPQPVFLDDLLRGYAEHLFPGLTLQDAQAPKTAIPRVVLDVARLQALLSFKEEKAPADALARQAADYAKAALP